MERETLYIESLLSDEEFIAEKGGAIPLKNGKHLGKTFMKFKIHGQGINLEATCFGSILHSNRLIHYEEWTIVGIWLYSLQNLRHVHGLSNGIFKLYWEGFHYNLFSIIIKDGYLALKTNSAPGSGILALELFWR